MNWYKQANSPELKFLSYNSYGELRVTIGGTPYTYYNVSPFWAKKLRRMIENPNIPGGIIIQKLKNFSDSKRHQELNPPKQYAPEEQQEMLDEARERGFLS